MLQCSTVDHKNSISALNELCTRIEVRCFSDRKITFLNEYCAVLKLLSRGLDTLQGEDNCFSNNLLPTLETIIKKFKTMKASLSSMTVVLVDCIVNAIKHCFWDIFENDDSILAAIVLSKLKLKWVESQWKKVKYKQLLLQTIQQYADNEAMTTTGSQEESQKANKKKDDFYEFKSDDEGSSQNSTEVEAREYLSNAKRFECLHKYQSIKKLFHMYNTVLPSSAPVERLQSRRCSVDTKAKQIN